MFLEEPVSVAERLHRIDWAFRLDDTGFLAHDIHPYPAKFIPQVPGTLIATLSVRGELVFDPFGGSGTTALEAVRLGRRALSVDANPLSVIIGRVKTANIACAIAEELNAFRAAITTQLFALPTDPLRLICEYAAYAPTIPNRAKWYADTAFGELCLLKGHIAQLDSENTQLIAKVALSRVALRASFQDSETRYKSVPRTVPVGETLRRYLREFGALTAAIVRNEPFTRFAISRFLQADAREISPYTIPDESVDLVVTSPPYGNATDYHLYHRFRLLWLDFDPVALSEIEIGSHLKHQREGSGFESYLTDLKRSVITMARVLRPGRYAALVLGDSVYSGGRYDPVARLISDATELGFERCCVIERPIHSVKRSFVQVGRRATIERILVLRKAFASSRITLVPPPYRLWPYERHLRLREVGLPTTGGGAQDANHAITVEGGNADIQRLRSLAFSHAVHGPGWHPEPTWQAILENGGAANGSARKDPKYATHGIHPYKGKYYPQLAKALINLLNLPDGSILLDPFCGSGTTLLEGYLNGFAAFGCDMHPLAAKIARAKTEVLDAAPDTLSKAVATVLAKTAAAPGHITNDMSEFPADCTEEIIRWFPGPVIGKINWLLRTIRQNSDGAVRDFLEVILSSVIREVSHQEQSDLRIRYRSAPIFDADVFGVYADRLCLQFDRIKKFWSIRGYAPKRFHRAHVITGDNRVATTFEHLGLTEASVDAIVTSPPYATALPYIDTDRLSLLLLFGLSSSIRRPLEYELMGSREITTGERRRFENDDTLNYELTATGACFVSKLKRYLRIDREAGFRKRNMPALVVRYLVDMKRCLTNAWWICKSGAETMIVIGDNKIELAGKTLRVPTTDLVEEIAVSVGFERLERMDISVTTENMLHQRNAITKNVVLRIRKPQP